MKYNAFEGQIGHIKQRVNSILWQRCVVKCLLILVVAFHIYFSFRGFLISPSDLMLLSNVLRAFSLISIATVLYLDLRKLYRVPAIARWLDSQHGIKDDLYQNVLEFQKAAATVDTKIISILQHQSQERLTSQQVNYPVVFNKYQKRIIVLILLSIGILWGMNYPYLQKSAKEYWLNQIQTQNLVTKLQVKPGDITIGRNQDVLIEVNEPVTDYTYKLFYRQEKEWREVVMPDGKYLFERLDYSFSYYVQTAGVRSETFRITMLDNPTIKRISISYHFPSYTKLTPEIDSVSYGNIEALKHTKVMLNIDTNIPVKSATMHFGDGKSTVMQHTGDKSFVAQLTVMEPVSYYIELIDELNRKSIPEEKNITVIPDNPPEIKLVEPGEDTILNQNMLLPVRITASDDFGLSNLYLKFNVNEQPLQSVEVKSIVTSANLDLDYLLSFQALNLLPGDVVTYWAEINDNSPELQKAATQKFKARFPSIEELYKEIENSQQDKKEELKDVLSQSKELQKDFEQKRREMLKDDKVNWEDKKQLENMVKTQQELSQQVDKVAENYQQLIDKLNNNQALSPETMEKMQKIQQIMQEINNDQMQKALEQFDKALKNLDPNAMKKAMENFKFSLDDFNKQIEQTLKLLESIKKEQAVQKALQTSEEMEKMQKALYDKTPDAKNQSDKLSDEQKNIKDKLDSIKDQLKETDKLLDPKTDKDAKDKMQEMEEMLKDDSLKQDMQDSQQSLSQNQRPQSMSKQEQAMEKMRKMTRKLAEMKESVGQGSSQQVMKAMQTAAREMMIFSQKHEESAGRYKQDPYPIVQDLLGTYEGVNLSINKLFANPMVMMFMPPKFFMDSGTTNQSYRDFFNNVNELQYFGITQNLEGIQKGLNLMAYDLIQAMNQSSSGGGGGGGMQSLQQMLSQMGEEQMAMNMLTSQMMQQMQQNGGRMGAAEQQQLQRLAGEQERLAENLKRALQNDPEAQKQGSSLKQMVEEMEAISRQLKQNQLNTDLLQRQERILSKLLDAQKSINKREFSQKRKGETAENNDFNRDIPSTDFNLLRKKAILDEQYRAFPKEYQQVIQQYLKALNEQK